MNVPCTRFCWVLGTALSLLAGSAQAQDTTPPAQPAPAQPAPAQPAPEQPAPEQPTVADRPADAPPDATPGSGQVTDEGGPPAPDAQAAAKVEPVPPTSEPVVAPQPSEPPELPPVPSPPPPEPPAAFHPSLVLDDGRAKLNPGDDGALLFQLHGEYQLRAGFMSDLPLQRFRDQASTDTLGQTTRMTHWLRLTPRLTYDQRLHLIGQIDVPRGMFAGQTTERVGPDRDPMAQRDAFEVEPRWLYLEWMSPVGMFRVGQQPSYWGMGLVANDGDHPTLFGDYSRGTITRRIMFATKPLSASTPLVVAIAGDLVVEDNVLDPDRDEDAAQAVFSTFYANRHGDMLGVYGVYRHQDGTGEVLTDRQFDEDLDVFVVDLAGRGSWALPSRPDHHVFGQFEVAAIVGETDVFRTTELTRAGDSEQVGSFGAAAEFGWVRSAGQGAGRWGQYVSSFEFGFASGDADPNDGTTRRFSFDPNHNVGLLLFDEVARWKTARAAAIAGDPDLVNRPAPGIQLLPSNGSVSGATYLYKTNVYRPSPDLDLKTALLLAWATADYISPVAVAIDGTFSNYDGGDADARFLGFEFDAGFEYRIELPVAGAVQLGAQGGLFFPGGAFEDARGDGLGVQWTAVGRAGLQY